MAITQITLFKGTEDGSRDAVRDALHASSEKDSVAGVQVQDRSIIQAISESDNNPDSDLLRQLSTSCGRPTDTYRVEVNRLALENGGPATSTFLEVVANYFPASQVTPDFRKQIEADFVQFDGIIKTVSEGDGGLAYGWSVDELDHEGEATRPFFILRGWRSMQDFEALTKKEVFGKEAIPILMAWKAPFKMVRSFLLAESCSQLTDRSGMLCMKGEPFGGGAGCCHCREGRLRRPRIAGLGDQRMMLGSRGSAS